VSDLEDLEPIPVDELPTIGPWQVRLTINCEHAESPADAVREFIDSINELGIATFMFRVVHEETGQTYFVEEGRTYSMEQLQSFIEDANLDGDDDEGDEGDEDDEDDDA
jgi:hypothetical protein